MLAAAAIFVADIRVVIVTATVAYASNKFDGR